MSDRSVSVFLTANVTGFLAGMEKAKLATTEFAASAETAATKQKASWDRVGGGMLLTGGIIAAGVGLAIKAAADFDHQMSAVQANINDKSAPSMQRLADAALAAGKATMFSAQDAADAENMLAKSGMTAANILGGGLTASLSLAAATQTSLADATMYTAATMEQYNLKGKDAGHIADVLAAGADKSLGGVNDLAEGLKYAGVPAHQFGVSLDETVGTLAMFAKNGILGTMAGTSLRMMFVRLAGPTSAAKADMKELGLTFWDSKGNFEGVANMAGQLHDKLAGLTVQQRESTLVTLFGARSLSESNILYQQGAAGVDKWTKAVNDQGFAALQASTKMNNLSGDLSILKTTLNVALVEGGQGGQAPLRTITQDVTALVNGFASLPAPVLQAGLALGAVTAGALLLGGAVTMATSRIAGMKFAMTQMGVEADAAGGMLAGAAGAAGILAVAYIATTAASDKFFASIGYGATQGAAAGTSLESFMATGKATGENAKLLQGSLTDLGGTIAKVFDPSLWHRVTAFNGAFTTLFGMAGPSDVTDAIHAFSTLDSGMAQMVTSGHADQASQLFAKVTAEAKKQGVTVAQLADALPQYSAARVALSKANALSGADAAAAAHSLNELNVSLGLSNVDAASSALLAMGAGATAVDANVKALAKSIQTDMDAATKAFAKDMDVLGNYNPKPLADAVTAAQDALTKAQAAAGTTTVSAAPKGNTVAQDQQVAKAEQAIRDANGTSAAKEGKARQNLSDLESRLAASHKTTVSQTQSVDKANSAVQDAQANLDKARQAQSAATLENSYKSKIADGNKFATDIVAVTKAGLDPSIVANLLAEGPTKAGPVLESLVGGNSKTMIKMVNDSEAALTKISKLVTDQAQYTAAAVASATATGSDQMTKDLGNAMAIDAANASSGGKATVESIAAQLHLGVPQVKAIAKEFGIGIVDGVTSGTTPAVTAINSITNALTHVPTNHTTTWTMPGLKPATDGTTGITYDLVHVPKKNDTIFTTPGLSLARLMTQGLTSDIDHLSSKKVSLSVAFGTQTTGWGPLKRDGGLLRGPGTGTSDSIQGVDRFGRATAQVSNGEFVVNQKSTAANLGLLELINSKRYALGGQVVTESATSPSAHTVDVALNQALLALTKASAAKNLTSVLLAGAGVGNTGAATGNAAANQAMARGMIGGYGWGIDQMVPLTELWNQESGWNQFAQNPSSPAYGIPQSDPGSKMASMGPDWRTNPLTQMEWGMQYIAGTYGSPAAAWAFEMSHTPHWYAKGGQVIPTFDQGGTLAPGLNVVANDTGGYEHLVPRLASGGLVGQVPGGFVAADLSGINARIPTNIPTMDQRIAALQSAAKATTALHSAEYALYILRQSKGHTARGISLDEERLANARGSLRAATESMRDIEAQARAAAAPMSTQFHLAATASNAATGAFLTNIDTLRRRGYVTLSDQLVTAGDTQAYALAAQAVHSTAVAKTLTGDMATSAREQAMLAARRAAVTNPAAGPWSLPSMSAPNYGARPAPGRVQQIIVKIGETELTSMISATVDGHTQQLINGLVYGGH